MSKLYTEEEVRGLADMVDGYKTDELMESLTPIELPTDEEIGKARDKNIPIDIKDMWSERFYFNVGAKWMRDKIIGGEK